MASSSSSSPSSSLPLLCALLTFFFLCSSPASVAGDVQCEGLPDGGKMYCHIACCIRQERHRQSYYCCGSDYGDLPPVLYREGGQRPKYYREDQRPDRYSTPTHSTIRIDWWNTLLISLAISIILSIILSLLCCLFCSRRR